MNLGGSHDQAKIEVKGCGPPDRAKDWKACIPQASSIAPSKPAARSTTKHDRIIAMLRTPAGATLASLVTATEWQQHSVRGFLAGVVRKKLGLNLVSEIGDKGRVYRIKDGKASPVAVDREKQAG